MAISTHVEVKPSCTKRLKYLTHITQIQHCSKGLVQARGPKVGKPTKKSETVYMMPYLLAYWIMHYKVQAEEAFWITNSRLDGNCIIQ